MPPAARPGTAAGLPAALAAATMSDVPSRAARADALWAELPGGVVDGGELVLLAIKPSMWRPVFESAAWLAAACVTALALTRLERPLPGLSLALTTQLVLLIGLARLGIAVVRWVPTWYVLTNRRIMNIQGVRAPRISSCLLLDVRNTYLSRPHVERLVGLGTITFVSEHPAQSPPAWRSITSPDEVHTRIRRAIESAIDHSHWANGLST